MKKKENFIQLLLLINNQEIMYTMNINQMQEIVLKL